MALIDISQSIKEIELNLKYIKEIYNTPLIIDAFKKDFEYRFCWSSNSLEGNTLSLDETIDLIEYDEVNSNHTFSEYIEAKNLYNAIKKYLSFDYREITEEWIKDINADILNREATYRNHDVFIGSKIEIVHYPPSYKLLDDLMNKYIENVNDKYKNIEELVKNIAVKHIEFEKIHPFPNGNGRTGRIILNQSLINNGLLPISILKNSKYKKAFIQYDRNKDTSPLEYIICKNELKEIQLVRELMGKCSLLEKAPTNSKEKEYER